ncbi:MAG: Hsp33 family molecular chaperone HslO [Burkholderiales bacterium]|nr:Hsp33 family molecular chaperone HslO [Burkholderiales bacterium]
MDRHTAGFDQLVRFWLETAPARGVVARFDASLAAALEHHDYPPAVAQRLRELSAAATLLASNLKQPAQVILQAQGSGDVPLLCVEATEKLSFRAYANVREGVQIDAETDLASLVAATAADARFVLSIAPEQGQMYQGIVALRGGTVADLLADYLSNSQQTQTRLWLRADGEAIEALLLERLPDVQSAPRAGVENADPDAAWDQVIAQAEATFAVPFMPFPYAQWLGFTFADHDVRMDTAQPVHFACACTMERVLNALKLVGEAEIMPLAAENGHVETRCEFCGKRYTVGARELSSLFTAAEQHDGTHPPTSSTLQ